MGIIFVEGCGKRQGTRVRAARRELGGYLSCWSVDGRKSSPSLAAKSGAAFLPPLRGLVPLFGAAPRTEVLGYFLPPLRGLVPLFGAAPQDWSPGSTSDYLAGVRAAWVVVAGSSSPRKYLGAFDLSLRLADFISGMAV